VIAQFANNSIGKNIVAVNRVESSKEIAPSLSHSTIVAPAADYCASLHPMQPESNQLLVTQ
jgi:hypothetical protein